MAKGKTMPSIAVFQNGEYLDLGEWKTYLGMEPLEWLKQFDGDLREISDASRRPYASFPVDYEKGIWVSFPQFGPLGWLSSFYELRACAELAARQTDKTLNDTETLFHLADSLKDEPALIPLIGRIAIWRIGLQVTWEGLQSRRWTDAQLATLQADLGRADFLKDLQLALHGFWGCEFSISMKC